MHNGYGHSERWRQMNTLLRAAFAAGVAFAATGVIITQLIQNPDLLVLPLLLHIVVAGGWLILLGPLPVLLIAFLITGEFK